LAADDDTGDNTPLSKLGALKMEDNAHLQLVNQAKGFAAKLDSLRLPYFLDDDASFILELPHDRHGVCEESRDHRTLLELNPFDKNKVLRRIKLLLTYWRRCTVTLGFKEQNQASHMCVQEVHTYNNRSNSIKNSVI